MKQFRSGLLVFSIALFASLGLARVHPFGDAGLFLPSAALPSDPAIPSGVRHILTAKCADCHSAQSRAPLYGRFAPASWLIERDIVRARAAMNLSRWQTYSVPRQQALKSEIARQAKAGRMPPLQYRLMHASARLSPADIHALVVWAQQKPPSNPDSMPEQGSAARGKTLFDNQCSGCHSLDQNHEGPRLRGVYGRTSGTAPGYAYSSALKQAHIVWNGASLDKWLANPDLLVPGNNMDFQVDSAQDRRDLIRYLRDSAAM